jgi:hypothetical protein
MGFDRLSLVRAPGKLAISAFVSDSAVRMPLIEPAKPIALDSRLFRLLNPVEFNMLDCCDNPRCLFRETNFNPDGSSVSVSL